MRKLAFGYSTRCNIRCAHCVAAGETPVSGKMDHRRAQTLIVELARAGVGGISFSAGEPFLYIEEISDLVRLCASLGIYTRIVTNSFWARGEDAADRLVPGLKSAGLCQLRLSFSRWHQQHIPRENVLVAARSCQKAGLDYFISLVTDFSEADDPFEQYLRDNGLKFFPEPVIYAGRAEGFTRRQIATDYQENRCDMNPYLTPDLEMLACCDAGSHFSETNFFHLGNMEHQTAAQLFEKSETHRLYNLIRNLGVTAIASFAGMPSREIITYGKCELCRTLFNTPDTLARLRLEVAELEAWHR